jgi:hypothetical protein
VTDRLVVSVTAVVPSGWNWATVLVWIDYERRAGELAGRLGRAQFRLSIPYRAALFIDRHLAWGRKRGNANDTTRRSGEAGFR